MDHVINGCGRFLVLALSLLVTAACGCGSGDSSSAVGDRQASEPQTTPSKVTAEPTPPVAAISNGQARDMESAPSRIEAPPGSPEAHLLQIADLVAAANAEVQRLQETESTEGADSPAAAAFHRHLTQVIDLATQVIAATHLDPQAEQTFNNAVHYLSDARLELASAGDADQARLLLEDADSLYERDKTSFAAAEASFKVVELAERMARSLGGSDNEWLSEYANQANRFAERFPDEQSRAAMVLFTAGRLCDRFGLTEQARQCLQRVQTQFGGTVFADQSAGILRRLSLSGQPLEFAGATIDGGFVDIDHYKENVVLVVFWSTTSPTFLEQLPTLQQIEAEFGQQGLSIIGVNLDKHEAEVDAFLTKHDLRWPQVFSADPEQRGGRNPVARYYGVQVLPTYWLVAPGGVVVDSQLDIAALRDAVAGQIPAR